MPLDTRTEAPQQAGREGPIAGIGAVGALIAAVGTASCCVLPLALFSLGAGGAWLGTLSGLAPYQPYFLAAAVLFLALGFWRVHRRANAECADGTACATPRSRRLVKATLWVSAALVAAAVAFNYAAPYLLPTS